MGTVKTAADMLSWPNHALHVLRNVLPTLPEFAGTSGNDLVEEA